MVKTAGSARVLFGWCQTQSFCVGTGWIYLEDADSLNAPVYPMEKANTVTETGPEGGPSVSGWVILLVGNLSSVR